MANGVWGGRMRICSRGRHPLSSRKLNTCQKPPPSLRTIARDGAAIRFPPGAIFFLRSQKEYGKKNLPKAVAHRDLYAPKRFFSRNTASKSHGRRQPCRGSFLCLAEKPIVLECFAVLNGRFFSAATSALAEILCVFQKRRRKLRGKRFIQNRVNPYAHPPNGGARRNRPSLGTHPGLHIIPQAHAR